LSVPKELYPSSPDVAPKKPVPPSVEPVPDEIPPPVEKPLPAGPPAAVKPMPLETKPLEFSTPGGTPSSPWVIKVEVVKTMTHLTATSKSAEFKVICEQLKVQSPGGDIQAEGKIKVAAAGLDMDCEKLTISWEDDWVIMEGKVRLLTQKDGQQVELVGDKLQLKLTTLTSISALKTIAPKLHQAAYHVPQAAGKTPAPSGYLPPLPKLEYKRVTVDEK
jgi:hypothetical protein